MQVLWLPNANSKSASDSLLSLSGQAGGRSYWYGTIGTLALYDTYPIVRPSGAAPMRSRLENEGI